MVTPPPEPNYASNGAWLSRPGEATLNGVPRDGGFTDLERRSDVDVFYLYPTTATAYDVYPPAAGENATYDDLLADGLAYEIGASQAGTFNGIGRIFAPFYRQVFMDEWMKKNPAAASAKGSAIAYSDVRRAFEYYLRHDNGGRPIVLVGHSQGSMLGLRLLKDEFDGKPLYRQLVAAYLPGQALDASFYRNFSNVHPCDGPTDTGCINSWGSFQRGISSKPVRNFIDVSPYFSSGNGNYRAPSLPVFPSENLVTWKSNAAASAAAADLGALQMRVPYPPLYYPHRTSSVYPMGAMTKIGFASETVGAKRQPQAVGFFVRPKPPQRDFEAYVPGLFHYVVDFQGIWHLYDYNLFWLNIRQNARDRVDAYLARRGFARPLIAGAIRVYARAGQSLRYRVKTIHRATAFGATGLPPRLSIGASSGLITGTPKRGIYAVVVGGSNAAGTSYGELSLVVR